MRFRPLVRRNRRGVALIVVLGCVVFLSILLLALLGSLKTELRISSAYARTNAASILGSTAVNVVMTQIRQATTETPGAAWASQPGMIRTFDSGGNLVKAYKLYSASKMIDTTINPTTEAAALTSWNTQTALYTDLNQPISGVFPILAPQTTSPTGYSVSNAPGATSATGNHPLPMPAQWLYVLQDGTLASPTAGTTGATAIVTEATPANPIVGRIAFWTDDETCKVNINTASEGTFWDTPRLWGQTEFNLALYQPQNGEYQTYPGHPAGVSLSTVFPSLSLSTVANATNLYSLSPRVSVGGSLNGTVTPTLGTGAIPVKTDRLYATVDEFLFAMSRVAQPASGTFNQTTLEQAKFFLTAHSRAPEVTLFGTPRISIWPVNSDLDPVTKPSSPYTTAYDRLTAFCSEIGRDTNSPSEPYRYYFQRSDADSPTSDYTNISRNQQLYGYLQNYTSQAIPGFGGDFKTKYGDDRDQILTEIFDYIRCTNLFDDNLGGGTGNNGVYTGPTAPTSFYQFTDPRTNVNGGMWPGYGQVTPIQITGPASGSKATMGFGRFFTLSEVGLHVICTADGNGLAPSAKGAANDYRTVSNLATPALLQDNTGKTVGLQYSGASDSPFPANPTLANTFGGTKTALSANQVRLQVALLFQITCPMQGWLAINPNYQIKVSGLDKISIGGKTNLFPASASSTPLSSPLFGGSLVPYGGNVGFTYPMSLIVGGVNTRVSGWSNQGNAKSYPFISNPFTVSSGSTMNIQTTAPVTVEIWTVRTSGAPVLAQTYQITFPSTDTPVPDLMQWGTNYGSGGSGLTTTADQWWGFDYRIQQAGQASTGYFSVPDIGCVIRGDAKTSLASPWQLNTSNSAWGAVHIDAANPKSDVIRTLVPPHGDSRLIAATQSVDSTTVFETCPNYSSATTKLAHDFIVNGTTATVPGYNQASTLVSGLSTYSYCGPDVPGDVSAYASTGDWDNGVAAVSDGAYINKPDEGNVSTASAVYPYFGQNSTRFASGGATFFTPNRILPSPGMLGSLPTGVKAHIPWKTLLFRPQPTHPANATGPKDYLIMDLFDMPVVQPYAISEPLSTAGKINMNYQILPFTYINRSTALCAALKAEKICAIPSTNAAAATYKYTQGANTFASTRWNLNLSDTNGTLRQFKARFDSGNVFRSAAEICDIYLVPSNQTWTSDNDAATFWNANRLTGDNTRERPYADLYARLTTKSNSFTVHYRAQSLQKITGSTVTQWREGIDVVTGEARGSTLIERFVDPNDATLPDYASNFTAPSLETHYKFRIVSSNTFDP